MSGTWTPEIPKYERVYCRICREQVTEGQAFHAAKQRGGGTIYIHADCWQQEQEELKKEVEA